MTPLTGPIDPHALSEGRRIYAMLPQLAMGEHIYCVPLHWSVEAYGCVDGSYNLVIPLISGQWKAMIATDPVLNATSPPQDGYAAHTWERNSFACGIAVDGMVGATTSNFGPQRIQFHELEVLCATAAAVCRKYGIDTHGTYNGLPSVFTHAEAAIADGYFGERWDLARLQASPAPLGPPEAAVSGGILRNRVHDYAVSVP